jgi:TPR repeat protein
MKKQIMFGLMMLVGLGVESRGAAGDARAEYELGRNYWEQTDYRAAWSCFYKAAAQGHAAAQNRLGVMYERGAGVRQDYVEAYKWYTLAAGKQNTFAVANREALRHSLTAEQIALAEERVGLFVAPMLGCKQVP